MANIFEEIEKNYDKWFIENVIVPSGIEKAGKVSSDVAIKIADFEADVQVKVENLTEEFSKEVGGEFGKEITTSLKEISKLKTINII